MNNTWTLILILVLLTLSPCSASNYDRSSFLLELSNDTYNYLLKADMGSGLPVNWYNYSSYGPYCSPEEAGFYMLSHIGAAENDFINRNEARNRVETTLATLMVLPTYNTSTVVWQLGDDEAPKDYTKNASDEFDVDIPYDPEFNVEKEPVSNFPKEINDQVNTYVNIYFNLTAAQAKRDQYLYLDTLYASHDDWTYCGLNVTGNGNFIGVYNFSSDCSNPESRLIRLDKSLLREGQNVINIQNTELKTGRWLVWDSLRLESDPVNHGLYYRYYDTACLVPTDTNVSSIGNAMLAASLMTIRKWADENNFRELSVNCSEVVARMNLTIFYNSSSNLFYHNFTKERSWDYYSDEGRLLSFVARALDDITEPEFRSNLANLKQPVLYYNVSTNNTTSNKTSPDDIRVNRTSWDGAMFTYIVPALFIKEHETIYQDTTINPAVCAQIEYANRSGFMVNNTTMVWGISDAYNTDGISYCDNFCGAPPTAARNQSDENPYQECHGLITPHASALALLSDYSDSATDNLINLSLQEGLYDGTYGFKDSFNVTSGNVTNRIVTLDQEWIFLALMNKLNGTVWRYFYKNPEVVAAHEIVEQHLFEG